MAQQYAQQQQQATTLPPTFMDPATVAALAAKAFSQGKTNFSHQRASASFGTANRSCGFFVFCHLHRQPPIQAMSRLVHVTKLHLTSISTDFFPLLADGWPICCIKFPNWY